MQNKLGWGWDGERKRGENFLTNEIDDNDDEADLRKIWNKAFQENSGHVLAGIEI